VRWCHSLLSDEFAQQRRSESHGNIDLACYFFQFSSFDLLTKLGGKRPSHSGRNSLFWKVCIFITTLFHYLNPALGPCAFFVYLRAFFSLFFTNIPSWFKAHLPQSPISLHDLCHPHTLLSRWVLLPRNLMLYRWPKQKIQNNKASRSMLVKVNIFFVERLHN